MFAKVLFVICVGGAVCRPQSRLPFEAQERSLSGFSPIQSFDDTRGHSRTHLVQNLEQQELERQEDENAKYEFASNVEDHISDLMQRREEIREGGSVKGAYSYSDGYYKITVEYVADKDGYRVLKMDSQPLEGPRIDKSGSASVSNFAHGQQTQYKIVSVPSSDPTGKISN